MVTTVNNNNIESNHSFQIGDKVKHNWFDDVATITAKRQAHTMGETRWLYTLDFGHTVTGPFGKDYNGEEFLAEAIKPLQQPSEITDDYKVGDQVFGTATA